MSRPLFIPVMSTGAWDKWRDEVRAGKRTATEPMDKLWHAMWCDANGLDRLDEYRDTGTETYLYLASMWFEESDAILREIELDELEAEAA